MKARILRFVLLLVILFSLLSCARITSRFKVQVTVNHTFNVVSGRVAHNIIVADEVNKMFLLKDYQEVIEYLKEHSVDVIESSGVSAERMIDILMRNHKMKKRKAYNEVNSTESYSYKYTVQPYKSGDKWLNQWLVYSVRRY